jgi:hypothetical protein
MLGDHNDVNDTRLVLMYPKCTETFAAFGVHVKPFINNYWQHPQAYLLLPAYVQGAYDAGRLVFMPSNRGRGGATPCITIQVLSVLYHRKDSDNKGKGKGKGKEGRNDNTGHAVKQGMSEGDEGEAGTEEGRESKQGSQSPFVPHEDDDNDADIVHLHGTHLHPPHAHRGNMPWMDELGWMAWNITVAFRFVHTSLATVEDIGRWEDEHTTRMLHARERLHVKAAGVRYLDPVAMPYRNRH